MDAQGAEAQQARGCESAYGPVNALDEVLMYDLDWSMASMRLCLKSWSLTLMRLCGAAEACKDLAASSSLGPAGRNCQGAWGYRHGARSLTSMRLCLGLPGSHSQKKKKKGLM